jgi:hypothetical protein
MTEQPVETEQQFLGNEARQHYAPNAHRRASPWLTTPTEFPEFRPAPVIALSRPFEVADATILLRKSITATAKLQLARKASEKAETALQDALAIENLAEIDAGNAQRELLVFITETADQ